MPLGLGAKRLTNVAAIVAIVGTSLCATAGAQAPPPITFAEQTPVSLSTEPVYVQVVNDTVTEWTLSVTASFDVVNDDVGSVPVTAEAPPTIGAGQSVTIELGPVQSAVTTASGFVVVTATGGGEAVVARRGLVVAPTAPKPKVEKWSGSNQDLTVSGAASGLPDLPLEGSGCGSLGEDSHDAAISAGSEIAALSYRCVIGADESDAFLVFDDDGVDEVGQYSGTLELGDETVQLSYLYSKAWWLAVLAIAIGLGIGVWRQIWISSIRPVRRTDERLTLIGRDALDRQDEFRQRAGTATYRVYDMVFGVASEVARLQTELADLLPSIETVQGWRAAFGWAAGDAQDRLDRLVEEAAALDDTVSRWVPLASELQKLDAQLRTIDESGSDEGLGDLAPFLVASARSLVAPVAGEPTTKHLTIAETRALIDLVPKTTAALELLPVAGQLKADLAALRRPDEPADYEVWAEARRLDRQARAELALAEDASALGQANVDDLLARARTLYRQLAEPPTGGLAALVEEEALPEPAIAFFSDLGRTARAVWSALGSTRGVDVVWLLVAIALAVWSGLTLFYLDKPWGRPTDFVILTVWAFGTTTILTPLLSALENVAAGALPLKKSKPDDKPNN